MNTLEPGILILGSDSRIGQALMSRLKHEGHHVIGTTRRPDAVGESCVYLDLRDNVSLWPIPESIRVAVLCAGVTRVEECHRNPQGTRLINVDGITALAGNLAGRGIFVIYVSSNQVFDGSSPYRLPDDPLAPVTEYGKQKAEVEARLAPLGELAAVVRFTKILTPNDPLFSAWSTALKNHEAIYPFSDLLMAPVPLSSAVTVLGLVALNRIAGILQVSGSSDIAYADAARMGAEVLNVPIEWVQPMSAPETCLRTGYTTLNVDRLRSILGVEPPPVEWTVCKAFSDPLALAGMS